MAETETDAKSAADKLTRYRRMFDDARTDSNKVHERRESMTDRDYYDGHQLSPDEKRILRERGQPELVINRIRRGVDGILGVVEQAKTSPRAYLRNPPKPSQPQPQQQQMPPGVPPQQQQGPVRDDLDAGDVASMTLRYISDTQRFPQLKMDALDNMLVEGSCAAIFETGQDQNVIAAQIRWEEFFYDPRSRRSDFKDARYLGIAKWMYADQVASIYKAHASDLTNFASSGNFLSGATDATWEDRPDNGAPWIDSKQRRVMVVEMYHLEAGLWMRSIFWTGGLLEDGKSPYVDDSDRPLCPIEAQSAYVDNKNRRYGPVRDMRGPQDEINMRRSKLLHLLNVRQVQQVDMSAPPIDADIVRKEAARPDGVIPSGWQIVPTTDMAMGQANLLAEAKAEIDRMAPNPAILGRSSADASGRAQQVRQNAGMTELARVLGRFNDWEMRCYKQMWSRARAWTDPKWIRVTDDDGAPQYVRINEPSDEPPQIMTDPQTGHPVEVPAPPKNHIAKMDVDIVVDTVPETATLEQEVFQDLAKIAGAYGPQAVPFEMMIELSSVPKKREFVRKLRDLRAEAAQEQAQGQQRQAQLAEEKIRSEIAEINSSTAKNLSAANAAEVAAVNDALQGHKSALEGIIPTPGPTGEAGPNLPQ